MAGARALPGRASNLGTAGTRTREALELWLRQTPKRQGDALLIDDLPLLDATNWFKLFEMRRPIVTQSLDLHAARRRPENSADVEAFILCWDSPIEELELFFQGKVQKILYREGCVSRGNHLLGLRSHKLQRNALHRPKAGAGEPRRAQASWTFSARTTRSTSKPRSTA